MFALEITFHDGVSQSETVFVRRPQALIGSKDFAHVVVEDMKSLAYQVRVVREVGRRFRCASVSADEGPGTREKFERTYDGEAHLALGPVSIRITALDTDLLLKDGEPPDRAGVKVLRQACSRASPVFPAVAVLGAYPMVVSFGADQLLQIGRSKECALRLDSAAISAQHARIGFEAGTFWIEDLGSTNGTFVNGQQVAGRVDVPPGTPVILGREVSISGVMTPDQLAKAGSLNDDAREQLSAAAAEPNYPVLLSLSEVARPARIVLHREASFSVGRDPASDMWLGAPHVSRTHCSVALGHDGAVVVSDNSTNGTTHAGGVLRRGDSLHLDGKPIVFDFGGGVTVAVCFGEAEERAFVEAHGSVNAFGPVSGERGGSPSVETPVDGTGGGARPGGSGRWRALFPFSGRADGGPLRTASKIGIVIVTISFAFALFLIVSLLKGVFI